MFRHSTWLTALALIVAAGPLTTQAAHACSCTNNLTLDQEFSSASVVFAGTVTAIQPAPDGFNLLVTMTPTARWKGWMTDPVTVVTATLEATCGFPFALGGSYLAFASNATANGQPALFTHLCSRTSALADNPFVPSLPVPLQPTPVVKRTWGSLKLLYR